MLAVGIIVRGEGCGGILLVIVCGIGYSFYVRGIFSRGRSDCRDACCVLLLLAAWFAVGCGVLGETAGEAPWAAISCNCPGLGIAS